MVTVQAKFKTASISIWGSSGKNYGEVTSIMDYIGAVNFNLVELTRWKVAPVAAGCSKMSELLAEIVEYRKRYDNLSPEVRSKCASELAKMGIEFIYKTSVGESVGLQSREDTRAVIDAYTSSSHNTELANVSSKLMKEEEKIEAVNICRALEHVSKLREEMDNTGILTVQQICDIHRVLMAGLKSDAGEIRKHAVYTLCGKEKEIHVYPEPLIAEQILYACVDHHCIQMSLLAKLLPEELLSITNVEFIFKRAARLLFDFVDAHPFGDGNGRTCRLLANYVVSLITPFPVTPSLGEGKNMKDDYLKAIIECRDHREKGPGALASMLIVDTWRGWRRLFASIT